mmetsp:Transcript_17059/g.22328  ORF Transcript_17059/g.22328 Transcript_17059/m.22328 type:complete len:615 (-) Transcript_17059:1887-3731(-)|eukprot:CAMPEP_0184009816 /NCGR_PEP_ID=MMETSP0954-20121128/2834_1 /TAXON_ID=627963 /ORGANISM="Aplanochytrium sp, Strain PBS07" /LENGTH=614 /DNA_ID=CAMNT_0026289269 /DNA_START=357 /DNA_END=2201 /DNA_ORIENTATION=+
MRAVLYLHLVCAILVTAQAGTKYAWTARRELLANNGEIYYLSYTVDKVEKVLVIKVVAKTTGWIGFGFGEPTSGSMIGADIVTASVDDSRGFVEVKDWFVGWSAYPWNSDSLYPVQDPGESDWVALSGYVKDGWTTVILKRSLSTGKEDDRDIVPGKMKIIYAYGYGSEVSYHGLNRGSAEVDFMSPPASFEAPLDTHGNWTLTMNKFSSFSRHSPTTYVCKSWELPTDKERHITAINVKLDERTGQFAHHLVLHICNRNVVSLWPTAKQCETPTASACTTLLYAWAIGGNPLILPPNAGFLVGTQQLDVRYVTLEIHYDVPQFATHLPDHDDSGVVLYYTETLRDHHASSVTLADPWATNPAIPKQRRAYHVDTVCPSLCTKRRLKSSVHVFASFLHMHAYGKEIYTTKNSRENIVNKVDFWNYRFQQIANVSYTINPGDSLHTHCTYDTSRRNETVLFGLRSTDEMCMDFVFYYPRMPNWAFCGNATFTYRSYATKSAGSVCGDNFSSFRPDIRNGIRIAGRSIIFPASQSQQSNIELTSTKPSWFWIQVAAIIPISTILVFIFLLKAHVKENSSSSKETVEDDRVAEKETFVPNTGLSDREYIFEDINAAM